MRIAFFQPDQVETVVDLLHEMSGHYNEGRASDKELIRANLVDGILGHLSGVRLLLALESERAVGLASIAILYPAVREMGHGIGTMLLRHVAEYALANNCIRVDWTTDRSNAKACALYERFGARPVDEKVYFRLTGDDLVRLAASSKGARDAD
jgi:GNAT superfamily N-acetyltransferase